MRDAETDTIEYACEVAEVEGRDILYVCKNGKNFQLDTLYDQDAMMDLWYQSLPDMGYQNKILFCGFGNGMYIRKLLAEVDESVRILVYEPSAIIYEKSMEVYDHSEILQDGRVEIVVEGVSDITFEDRLYEFLTYHDIKNCIIQAYPNYDRIVSEQVKYFDEQVQLAIMKIRATQNVLARYGMKDAKNSLCNRIPLMRSKSMISLQKELPLDVPAIIISSGPSLNKNIEELKRAKGRAFLVAVDSAVPALMKHDVIPDIIVTVDSNKNTKHIDDPRAVEVAMICCLESQCALVAPQKGAVFFMNDQNPYIAEFNRRNHVFLPNFSTGGSVANSACAVLTAFGFKNIVFVGQDLAYTDNLAYAAGTVGSQRAFRIEDQEEKYVDGYYGGKVRSSSEFILYLDWFVEEIAQHPEISFYNATEGGALIRGAQNISLREVIGQLCLKDFNIDEIVDRTQPLYDDEQKKQLEEYMKQLPERLEKDKQDATRAIRDYEKICQILLQKNSYGQIRKLLDSASVITKRLETAPEMYYVFCYGQQRLQDLSEGLNDQTEDVRKDILNTAQRGKDYLEAIRETVDELADFMKMIAI